MEQIRQELDALTVTITNAYLSRREQFAAMTMNGIIAKEGAAGSRDDREKMAVEAVVCSDALIAELDKPVCMTPFLAQNRP